jgi:hypothetical protein
MASGVEHLPSKHQAIVKRKKEKRTLPEDIKKVLRK